MEGKEKKIDTPAEEEDIAEVVFTEPNEEKPKISIDDLPGVGPATAEKLREAGYDELLSLAVMTPSDLADAAELGEGVSAKIISAARKMADIGGFVSGNEI